VDRPKNTILEVIAGSRAYGTDTPESDTDIRGIYILPQADRLSLGTTEGQQSDESQDIVYYELAKFFKLAMDCNPNIIELLYTPHDCINSMDSLGAALVAQADSFLSKKAFHTFTGYAHAQIKRAKGQNKWINNPQPKDPPNKRDFCWFIDMEARPAARPVAKPREFWAKHHVSKVEHADNLYRLYTSDDPKGVFRGESEQLVCESIPKLHEYTTFAGLMIYNEMAYDRAKKDHKHYWEWMANRNEARYRNQEQGITDYDCKNMMHCMRLLWSGISILNGEGPIVRFFGHKLRELQKIRAGEYTHEEVMQQAEALLEEAAVARDNSQLPEKVDRKALNKLYLSMVESAEGSI
jgi:predicted nucleotidyltransferase